MVSQKTASPMNVSRAVMQIYCEGIFNVWPAFNFRGVTPGLAACKADRLMPVFRAMLASVSPAATTWVCGFTTRVVCARGWDDPVLLGLGSVTSSDVRFPIGGAVLPATFGAA